MTPLIDRPAPFLHRYNVGDTQPFLDAVLVTAELNDEVVWSRAQTGGAGGLQKTSPTRTNLNFPIEDAVFRRTDDHLAVVYAELVRAIEDGMDHYCDQYDLLLGNNDSWGINRYEMGAEYVGHDDKGGGNTRLLSVVIYLNAVEGGGETRFPIWDLTISPDPGKMLIFPSSYPYAHSAEPPTSGSKYSMVTWFHAR